MAGRVNCWEFKNCGREPGGHNVTASGVCPATIETRTNGINNGINGGRCCWAVAGTFCQGEVQGTFASKLVACLDCDFFHVVQDQQSITFVFFDDHSGAFRG